MSELKIGVLGAAAISPAALYRPASEIPGVRVTAIAARDRRRAAAVATKWSIPEVADGYDDLLARDIDAVYVPLPNGLHGRWAHLAATSGHHVLCEKPLTANAAEARELMETARARPGQILTEAFHWRYHPWVDEVRAALAGGEIGEIVGATGTFCVPNIRRGDIRWNASLAGGALMDLGCYPMHMLRTFLACEPTVLEARMDETAGGVDRRTRTTLDFDGVRATIDASMLSARLANISLSIRGTLGTIRVLNPVAPHVAGRVVIETTHGTRRVPIAGISTYECQLRAFTAACAALADGDGATPAVVGETHSLVDTPDGVVTLEDSVANMAALDAVRAAAGHEPLRPTV